MLSVERHRAEGRRRKQILAAVGLLGLGGLAVLGRGAIAEAVLPGGIEGSAGQGLTIPLLDGVALVAEQDEWMAGQTSSSSLGRRVFANWTGPEDWRTGRMYREPDVSTEVIGALLETTEGGRVHPTEVTRSSFASHPSLRLPFSTDLRAGVLEAWYCPETQRLVHVGVVDWSPEAAQALLEEAEDHVQCHGFGGGWEGEGLMLAQQSGDWRAINEMRGTSLWLRNTADQHRAKVSWTSVTEEERQAMAELESCRADLIAQAATRGHDVDRWILRAKEAEGDDVCSVLAMTPAGDSWERVMLTQRLCEEGLEGRLYAEVRTEPYGATVFTSPLGAVRCGLREAPPE